MLRTPKCITTSVITNSLHILEVAVSSRLLVNEQGDVRLRPAKSIELSELPIASGRDSRHVVIYMLRDLASADFYVELSLASTPLPIESFLYRAWSEKLDGGIAGIPDAVCSSRRFSR